MKFITEVDALLAVEKALRATLEWQWEDGADDDCAESMKAVRQAVDDLDVIRRILGRAASSVQQAGSKGGLARAANLSHDERSFIARMGAKARWAKPEEPK
jgi:hypothetical protein